LSTPFQTQRVILQNGITVLVVENPVADIVATRCFIRGGSKLETLAQAGISHLTMNLLTRGTVNFSSQAIAEQVEFLGASLGTESTADYFSLSSKTVAGDFEQILELTAEILRFPNFPDREIELERRLTLQAIRSQNERPFTIAYEILQGSIYGKHPYALPSLGTQESISQVNRQDLISFHLAYFRPEQLVISIAGRVKADSAIALVEQLFGSWQVTEENQTERVVIPEFRPETIKTYQENKQAIIMLGYGAPEVYSPDFAVLKLIASYLGNGLSSRLFVELREKRGLAYEVSAFYPTRQYASQFVAYIGTSPHQAPIAQDSLKAECDRLKFQLLSEHELRTAKSKILGQYALGKQTNGQIAQILGLYETLGLGLEFDLDYAKLITAVSEADVQRVAQTYFTAPAISIIGPV
jgi:zinc protease